LAKKYLMVQIWRIQQSQALISIFFWALTLAGVYYLSYFHPLFRSFGLPASEVALGTIILFLCIVVGFLIIGVVYDKVLRLWREQTDVAVERNPYSVERMQPKEIVQWKRFNVSIMKELAKTDSAIQKDIEFMEKWIAKSLAERPDLRKSVEGLEKWVMG
jgi:predicted PurR-regulated permease PerM